MELNDIRNEALTEDSKMETIADFLQGEGKPTLDRVLANGNTATGKEAKIVSVDSDRNFSVISDTQLYTQKEYADGAAIAQLTSDGKLSIDYDPEQGNPSYLTVEINEGAPRVLMSDDVKAAFRAALGLPEEA